MDSDPKSVFLLGDKIEHYKLRKEKTLAFQGVYVKKI